MSALHRRMEAVVRLLTPDHLTPQGARMIRRVLDEEGPPMITVEDYRNYHDEHCPILDRYGMCTCWKPEQPHATGLGTTEPSPDEE